MPEYIVTYTSMTIDAESPEIAIDRAGDMKGGGNWEAEPVLPAVGDLERAIQRGQSLIDADSDAGEEGETRLSDVLADLMHWANHNHVIWDNAVMQAEQAREAELADWDAVLVSITNTYEDGHESEYEVWVPAPADGKMPSEQWWEDEVFPHTGDGHGEDSGLGAWHEATIIRASDPNDTTMCGVSNEWDG